jgi:TRAP-type C4-dicarboxylate transport system permease small subunit
MLTRLAAAMERALAWLLAGLLAAIVLAVTWQVVSRYVLGDASGWTEELARFLLIWIGLLGGALAYQRRLHLGLDLLPGYLQKRRPDGVMTALNVAAIDVCVLVFAVAILVVGGGALVLLTLELEQYSPALGLPMGVVYLCLPASGILMCVSALAAIVDPPARAANSGSAD